MELRQACLKMIRAMQGGWDAMAGALGMSRNALENRVYEKKGQALLVETAMQMQSFSQTTFFAEAIAIASGGTFLKLPNVDHIDNDSILGKMNELHVELGEWCAKFAAATKDGEIDRRERADLSAVVDEIHRTLDEMRALTFRVYCRDEGADGITR